MEILASLSETNTLPHATPRSESWASYGATWREYSRVPPAWSVALPRPPRARGVATFVSKTVCLGEWNPLWGLAIAVMRAVGRAPFVQRVRAAEVEDAIREAGFEILETGAYPASSHSRFVVARKP